jgi:elongation factor P
MASTPVINLRRGHAVRHNGDVCIVSDTELKTPPRMASYVQMSIRSIATGKVHNLRMTSNESMDSVNLNKEDYEYSYKDGDGYHFLHPETYEDVLIGE